MSPFADRSDDSTAWFYRSVLGSLQRHDVPFLLGGAFALAHYANLVRPTKDLDLFLRRADLDHAMQALRDDGHAVDLPYPHWLAKVRHGDDFSDLIFNSGNGVAVVDDEWFTYAEQGSAFDTPVLVCPAEETIWSKSYVMERERFDGADVAHLLLARGATLDWPRLLRRFGERHWRVLLAHLVLFGLIYPRERDRIPDAVLRELTDRMVRETSRGQARMCGGTLLSREQYLIDIEQWGYADARLAEHSMNAAELALWTASIRQR